MSRKKITELVPELLESFLKENRYELFNIEYIKEGKDWYLRIYIDKMPGEDGSEQTVGIDDCEKVSRFISDRLDEADLIERNYFLEVSSPGLDRPLLRDQDFEKYRGRIVDVFLYKALNGSKSITGVLEGLSGDLLLIKDEKGKTLEIPRDKIAKTKLAVIF